jgi:hypothetical protein
MGGNDDKEDTEDNILARIRDSRGKWVPGISGGLAGGVATLLFIVIPVINTWLANAKEISLAQIKNSADQIAYISKRMEDSDKERDLYKSELLKAQLAARDLEAKLFSCENQNRLSK